MFSRERGLHRAVAKGARKPGTKMSGKSEPLNINRLLLAKGKSLDIITQCESIETFSALRLNLERLAYALYFAELSQTFGQELSQECEVYFDRLSMGLALLAEGSKEPTLQCLEFELMLLSLIGLSPELTFCVGCREPLSETNLSSFSHELGGVLCQSCVSKMRKSAYSSYGDEGERERPQEQVREAREGQKASVYLTPMVWKRLILSRAEADKLGDLSTLEDTSVEGNKTVAEAARRISKGYIEYKSGRRMRALDILASLPSDHK